MCLRPLLGAFMLSLAWGGAPVSARTRADDARPLDPGNSGSFCLPVHGTLADSAPTLRLAAAALDPLHGAGTAQAMFSRLLGVNGAAQAAASAPPGAASGMTSPFGAPSATTRQLFDGSADLISGRHDAAEQKLVDCVQSASSQHDSLAEAACANNLAVTYATTGRPAKARVEFERALELYQTPRTRPPGMGLTSTLRNSGNPLLAGLAGLLEGMPAGQRTQNEANGQAGQAGQAGQEGKPAAPLNEGLTRVWRQTDHMNTLRGIELVTLNLGNLALASGLLAETQTFFQRALDSHPTDENPQCRAAAAMDMARLYKRLNRSADGEALLQQYPARPLRKGESDSGIGLVELGTINLASANPNQAGTVGEAARSPVAPASGRPATPSTYTLDEPSGRFGDGALTQLLAQARNDATTAPPAQAMQSWQRLALRSAAGDRPDLEFAAHAALMRLYAAQGGPAQAIFHGKVAANLAQATRANLSDASPSHDARRAFLRERRQVYVGLAQLLMDEQRLLEAETVLQLLKEDEGQQFVDGRGAAVGRVLLTVDEQREHGQDDDVVKQLRQTDQNRISAAGGMPGGLASGAILMMSPTQVETTRLKQGLALSGLPAQFKREPPRSPGSEEIVRDTQAFFQGPQRRVETFLAHLIEDAPLFDPPASADELAQLADTQRRLPQIQAELAPYLRDLGDGPSVSVGVRRSGTAKSRAQETQLWHYPGGEVMERIWRNMHGSDAIETRYLQRNSATLLPAATAATAANPAGMGDETLPLLARQTVPTALLYYLPGDERLDILMVGANGRRHFRLALSRAELDASVDVFVKALKQYNFDPRPAARAMYDQLFAPVAQAVEQSGARVLALSLADKLRFVPFAALHDDQGWLVERYAFALHPGGSLTGRLNPASPGWRAAAFGASNGSGEFQPLSNVRGEIDSVVRQSGTTAGVLPGDAWLNEKFTAQRLRAALTGGAKVVHIASHFKFVAGDAAASHLLLGDGGTLSLRDLASPQYRFDRTELVTLSACATGLSADDTYGQEVDGLAALLMGQGAPSVLASLWEVNDTSTATLMASLYRLHESRQLSRAAALQQAQLAMIQTAAAVTPIAEAASESQTRAGIRVRLPGDPEPAPGAFSSKVPSLGYGHPFYWSAFVLMGDWL